MHVYRFFVYMQKGVWRRMCRKTQSSRMFLRILGTVCSFTELRLRRWLFQHGCNPGVGNSYT